MNNYYKYSGYIFFSILFALSIFYLYSGYTQIKINKSFLYNKNNNEENITIKLKKNISNNLIKANPAKEENIIRDIKVKQDIEILYNVKEGDNLSNILSKFIKEKKEVRKIIIQIAKFLDPRSLRINQKIFFYHQENDLNKLIYKIIIPINNTMLLQLTRENNDFLLKKISIPLETIYVAKKYKINKSLYNDGIKKDIPLSVISKLINLYSFDFDFQRDIRVNDEVSILYEVFFSKKGREVSYGDIIYTNLVNRDKNYEYFIFKNNEGFDYYDRDGKNVRKSLMKTPIDGARLSSSFGLRKHPILGYTKMHKGVDFAAPTGTPIYAAGNGVINKIGYNKASGNFIKIRHNNSYTTVYAHLKSFKKGIVKNSRVIQGQTIGYVGSTGLATGPHLHYEIRLNGESINPMKIKLPPQKTLSGKQREVFLEQSGKIYSDFLFYLFE